MGGMFGVVSRKDCVTDLFFGIDYHSHLGTKKGGIAVYGENGFNRAIHNISNSPFRTKFENDIKEMSGKMGIGCISDNEPQPLLINCRLGSYAIVSVGRVANMEELIQDAVMQGSKYYEEGLRSAYGFKSKNTYKDTTYSFCMLVAYLRLKKRNRGNQIISISWKNI